MAQPNHNPTPRRDGRGSDRPFLPRGRCLRPSQPLWRSTLRIHKAACGLGSHRACALPAASRRGERTLVLARRREVLLSPVPGSGGAAPFLVPSAGEEAQALRMEVLRRDVLSEMVSEPETLLIDSALLSVLHPLLRFPRARASQEARG